MMSTNWSPAQRTESANMGASTNRVRLRPVSCPNTYERWDVATPRLRVRVRESLTMTPSSFKASQYTEIAQPISVDYECTSTGLWGCRVFAPNIREEFCM